MKYFTRITLLTILLPTMSFGGDKLKHEEHENTSGVEMLSHDLRNLLSKEMQALQSGVMSIIPDIFLETEAISKLPQEK